MTRSRTLMQGLLLTLPSGGFSSSPDACDSASQEASAEAFVQHKALIGKLTSGYTVSESVAAGVRRLHNQDLRMLDPANFPLYNATEPCRINADVIFDNVTAAEHLTDALNQDELEAFKKRFEALVDRKCARREIEEMKNATAQNEVFDEAAAEELENAKPVITHASVALINSVQNEWVAVYDEEFALDLDAQDVRELCGLESPSGESLLEKEQSLLEEVDAEEEAVNTSQLPQYLDLREAFPHCAEVVGHVRDQGQCGTCWAQTTAAIVEGRLCIQSGGAFSGPSAYISAGYIASCANGGRDGCQGGYVKRALQWVGIHGVPTGGNGGDIQTCVPYFAGGNAMRHFESATHRTPPCPTTCVSEGYPRRLQDDTFVPEGLIHTHTTRNFEAAKKALHEHGTIGFGMKVYSDFMAYRKGVYKPTVSQYLGFHAVTGIGYGPDYILAVNSWSERWGDSGTFKIHKDHVLLYWLPGAVGGMGMHYPFPIPNGGDAPPRGCFHDDFMYLPLDMYGTGPSKEFSVSDCQKRCKNTRGCVRFSYWHDGVHDNDCHLHDDHARPIESHGVTSGPAECTGDEVGQSKYEEPDFGVTGAAGSGGDDEANVADNGVNSSLDDAANATEDSDQPAVASNDTDGNNSTPETGIDVETVADNATVDVVPEEQPKTDCCGGCDFNLVDSFSTKQQGVGGWYYLFAPPESDSYRQMAMTTDGTERWNANGSRAAATSASLYGKGRAWPSEAYDAVYAWEAPGDGVAKISGVAREEATRCGDGTRALIKGEDGEQYWSRRLLNRGQAHEFGFVVAVEEGDRIFFRLSYDGVAERKEATASCDGASLKPTIAFVSACRDKDGDHSVSIPNEWTGLRGVGEALRAIANSSRTIVEDVLERGPDGEDAQYSGSFPLATGVALGIAVMGGAAITWIICAGSGN